MQKVRVSDEKLIESYNRHQKLFDVGKELDMPWQTVYYRLRKAGVEVTGNKARHGSEKDKLAALGESIFSKLVPDAKDNNSGQWQSKFDFDVCGLKVDVKTARPVFASYGKGAKRWGFSVKKQKADVDFFVCMALTDNLELDRVFLFPADLMPVSQMLSIPTSGRSKWMEHEIDKGSLAEFFAQYTRG